MKKEAGETLRDPLKPPHPAAVTATIAAVARNMSNRSNLIVRKINQG